MTAKIKETAMRLVFALAAVLSVLAVIFICIFLFAGGAPAFRQIGVLPFLTGQNWRPLQNEFGIFPMIIGSIYVTAGAIVVGVPLGIGTAVFLARFCPAPLYRVLKPAVNLLAGIPSIVYGFFGLTVLVPAVQALFGTSGKGVLTASLVLELTLDSTPLSQELEAYMQALCRYTDKLTLRTDGTAQDAPCVRVCRADSTWTGLAFHGVPGGHEFTSFVLGLYNAAGPGQALDEATMAAIQAIQQPTDLQILVSLHHVPRAGHRRPAAGGGQPPHHRPGL